MHRTVIKRRHSDVGLPTLAILRRGAGLIVAVVVALAVVESLAAEEGPDDLAPDRLAAAVTIVRDEFGTPHVHGKTDEATLLGFGYAQAEDYFWQVEDSYILALGRYAEAHGPQGLNSDVLNHAFEIAARSERDFATLDRTSRRLCTAFIAGVNRYLDKHPRVRPRLIARFEPWHVLALHRHAALELAFRLTGLSEERLPRRNPQIWPATGSNGWLLAGSRTSSGAPMLLAAPHMPWFGFGQLAEAHLTSDGGAGRPAWNFTGAHFYGSPALALGRNARLGWTLVTNEPDIADVWRERFTHPDDPLAYEYDGSWRVAREWADVVRVRKTQGFEERRMTFRATHHGPIVAREDDGVLLAANIAGLFETVPLRQSLQMARARNLAEFRVALAGMQTLFMNTLYADADGNILFLYTCRAPRRNPQFDWSKPVEGRDPATEWLGVHELDELPQVLNPAAGFLQNCNSSPYAVTDGDNPTPGDFPPYLVRDADVQTRRAKRSLEVLRGMHNVSFEDWQAAAFDARAFWATTELPRYAAKLEELAGRRPKLAERVRPYLAHLLAWNGAIEADSTAATLCTAWFEQLYGPGYPGEELRPQYRDDPAAQLEALVVAAERLEAIHGKWQIAYGDLFRIQRRTNVVDLIDLRFDDAAESFPSLGGHGPLGIAFTQYYTPSVEIPLVISQKRRYAIVGTSYLAAWEFAPGGARGASLVPFGASADPKSPHYLDQAKLLGERRMKTERFTPQQVSRHALRTYHP
ncbi:MAG: penicillin acylase family protein [Pirellulales bacterium]|nr:penicillin acylase family protein [Pirellulales bacterium]